MRYNQLAAPTKLWKIWNRVIKSFIQDLLGNTTFCLIFPSFFSICDPLIITNVTCWLRYRCRSLIKGSEVNGSWARKVGSPEFRDSEIIGRCQDKSAADVLLGVFRFD